ncbi:MAG: helicase-associated domain-containing protein [Chloroflexota bacterium]
MANSIRTFDPYFPKINADDLKKMLPTYGYRDGAKMRKQACIDALKSALADPNHVRKIISKLNPFQRLALAFIKQAGGEIEDQALVLALLASGVEIPVDARPIESRYGRQQSITQTVVASLTKRGLVMGQGGFRYSSGSVYFGSYAPNLIFSDYRLLAGVDLPNIPTVPLETYRISPNQSAETSLVRMPTVVMLDIISFLHALENIDGIRTTQKGKLRVTERRKLQKALQWSGDDLERDGLIFKDAAFGLLHAMHSAELVDIDSGGFYLAIPTDNVAEQEPAVLISSLLDGFRALTAWNESGPKQLESYGETYRAFRVAFLLFLTSIPHETDAFYTVDVIDRALYERIGAYYSLYGGFGKRDRATWVGRERPWIEAAFSSWLHYLGMVELRMKDNRIVAFRLTPLGKSALHPHKEFATPATSAPSNDATQSATDTSGVWVVQPNFDVIVYLKNVTPRQLTFLERHAQRIQSQQYTATYRITRDAIYQGLERGTEIDDLLAALTEHAQTPLPQNVVTELKEWAALREQVVLHHNVSLMEFATEAAREAALNATIAIKPIGDRFLLVKPLPMGRRSVFPVSFGPVERINYRHPLPEVLTISEEGKITLKEEIPELMLKAQLNNWAEHQKANIWQLTKASVSAQVRGGRRIDELLYVLNRRGGRKIPAFLELALRNWGGRPPTATFGTYVMLDCPSEEVLKAILSSEQIKKYVQGRLEGNVLLFAVEDREAVQALLVWAGLELEPVDSERVNIR